MRKLFILALLATKTLGAQTTPDITTADLEHRLKIIADDSMMGRESGSKGDFMAANYIASEFRRLGLTPAGEHGTYFQTVPFWKAAIDPASQLTVQGTTLHVGADFLPLSVRAAGRTLHDAPVVYGGNVSDSAGWIATPQAMGKFVVLDVPPGMVVRGSARFLPHWRGALVVALVTLDQLGSESIARLREGRPVSDTTRDSSATPLLAISRHAATLLLGAAPSTLSPGATGLTVAGQFDIARLMIQEDTLVMIVDGNCQFLFGFVLTNHVTIEEGLDLRRAGQAAINRSGLLALFLFKNLLANTHAFIANVGTRIIRRRTDELLNLLLRFMTERTAQRFVRAKFSHGCRPPTASPGGTRPVTILRLFPYPRQCQYNLATNC